jgi:hypothetical protein
MQIGDSAPLRAGPGFGDAHGGCFAPRAGPTSEELLTPPHPQVDPPALPGSVPSHLTWSGAPHATVPGARSLEPTRVRPVPVGTPHDCAAERHVALPVPDAPVTVSLKVGRATGQREHHPHHDRPPHRAAAYRP